MVIDSDAHINESLDELAERLDAPYRSRAPRLLQDTLGLTRILMEGRLYPDPRLRQRHSRNVQGKDLGGVHRGAVDPHARLDDLDTDGIDVQVVYGSLGLALTTIRDTDFAIAIARALNDYYARFCDTAPTRLAGGRGAARPGRAGRSRGAAPSGRGAGPRRGDGSAGGRRAGARRRGPRSAVRRSGPARRADLGALGQRLSPPRGGNRALRHPFHGPRDRPSLRADDRVGRDRVRRRARRPPRAASGLPRGRVRVGAATGSSGWRSTTSGARRRCPGCRVRRSSTCPTGAASSPPSRTSASCPKRWRSSASRR